MFCEIHPDRGEGKGHGECDIDILYSRMTGKNIFPAKIKSYNRKGIYCESGEFIEKGTMIYYKIENILKWVSDRKAHGGMRTVSLAEVESCREVGADSSAPRYGTNLIYNVSTLVF